MIRIYVIFILVCTGFCFDASWKVTKNGFKTHNLKLKSNSKLNGNCEIKKISNSYAVNVDCLKSFPLADLNISNSNSRLMKLELELWLSEDTPNREIELHSARGVNRYPEWVSIPNTVGLSRSRWTTLTWYFPHFKKNLTDSVKKSHINFSAGDRSSKRKYQIKRTSAKYKDTYKLYDDESQLFYSVKDIERTNPNIYLYDLKKTFIRTIKVSEISSQVIKTTDKTLDEWIKQDTYSLLDNNNLLIFILAIFLLITCYVIFTSPTKISSQLWLVVLPIIISVFFTFPRLIFELANALDFSLKTRIYRTVNESHERILEVRERAQRACMLTLDAEIRKLKYLVQKDRMTNPQIGQLKWLELSDSIIKSGDQTEIASLIDILLKERGNFLRNYSGSTHPFWNQKIEEYKQHLSHFADGKLSQYFTKDSYSIVRKLVQTTHPLCFHLGRIFHDYDTEVYLYSKQRYFQRDGYGPSRNSRMRSDFKVIARRVTRELNNDKKVFGDSSFDELRKVFQDYGGSIIDLHAALEEPLKPVSILNSNVSQTYEDFFWTWVKLDKEEFFAGVELQHRYVTHETYRLIKSQLLTEFDKIGLKIILKRRDWRRDYPRSLYNQKHLMKFAAKVHHIDQETTEVVIHRNQKSLLVGRRIPLARTFVCFDFSLDSILLKHRNKKNTVFWAILLGFSLIYGFIHLLANGLLKPLKQLDKNLYEVIRGNFKVKIPHFIPRDLNRLSVDLELLVKELKETEDLTGFLADSAAKNIRDLRPTKVEEVCILFCGIFGLESLSQDEQMEILARFLDQNQTILDKHGAMIDKFTGSACLAVFRHNNIIDCPLLASKEILSWGQQTEFNLNLCIGLSTGKAMLGHVGSPRRKDYTCIGDTVNLAARLETLSLSRNLPLNRVYLDKNTYLNHYQSSWQFKELEPLQIKGKSEKQEVYVFQS